MFLKKGAIPKRLYPGSGGEFVETISLGRKVNRLYVVMNGFETEFTEGAYNVGNITVNLSVRHTDGSDTAQLHCKFRLSSDSTWGGTFSALCDYVLIGENYTPSAGIAH